MDLDHDLELEDELNPKAEEPRSWQNRVEALLMQIEENTRRQAEATPIPAELQTATAAPEPEAPTKPAKARKAAAQRTATPGEKR